MTITEVLAGIFDPQPAPDGSPARRAPEALYGSRKMWAHLNRQGITVASCTVERLMADHGWQGVTRQRKVRTTVPDPDHPRAPDLLDRQFGAEAPNLVTVADFTYVPLAPGGFGYTAFVIDAFAGVITGWECSASKETTFVQKAIRQGAEYRRRQGHPLTGTTVHHSDAGSQYTSVRCTETLFLAGMVASIGTIGDAYDNALAETTIGLYKTECVRADSPFRNGPINTLADLEAITSAWVHWYNTSRLMHRLGLIPPIEAEAMYYAQNEDNRPVVHT
jgi:putative transposase